MGPFEEGEERNNIVKMKGKHPATSGCPRKSRARDCGY